MKLPVGFTQFMGRTGLKLQKYSPELMLAGGLLAGGATIFLACRATLKIEDILEEHNLKIDKIEEGNDLVELGKLEREKYPEEDYRRDLSVTYVQTGVAFAKAYLPAATMGILSVGLILGSFRILKNRNVALMAAYKLLEEGFTAYRKRVVEEHGEKIDHMYRHGLREVEVTEAAYTDEDGVKHPAKKEKVLMKNDVNTNDYSVYSRVYDEFNPNWSKGDDYNLTYLKHQQNFFNDLLATRGHVFLTEVYDALGFPRTKASQIVGWMVNNGGDDFVDFGIFDTGRAKANAFINGAERSIVLDFNVDGIIYDKI